MPPREWNAASYDRMSDPQLAMARDVIDRLDLRGDERVLDAGCGSGRVTEALLERVPNGTVIAVDGSQAMVDQARERLGDRVEAFAVDLLDLTVTQPFDAILSTATFHWIGDHERLFTRLHDALRPGGRLAVQCGGAGNIANVQVAIDAVDHPALRGWPGPWNFAAPEETTQRLARAGFTDIWTWLQPWPVDPPDPREYFTTVILGSHLERLSEDERAPFVDAVLEKMDAPVRANYVRLNLLARRAN
ncbi:methyltransferase domain-containing protein [Solirubrobacter phytolaccae]|uniref:Methyltransferase domain-containing protein n=1 Tax=Solirubrobacter phytolaccae TaxID=1404360 RepID=A0A9X3SD74_9ACTN|nr:methyltransferase domain-containing protein [Solirubrobacter phytolaccae]MDA0183350.1 methyltransferase domain-containing protein [Solirubrobacter phytolaccae]